MDGSAHMCAERRRPSRQAHDLLPRGPAAPGGGPAAARRLTASVPSAAAAAAAAAAAVPSGRLARDPGTLDCSGGTGLHGP